MNHYLKAQLIFNVLDRIEDITGVMAHEDPAIANTLRDWQDGVLNDTYMIECLNKYYDAIKSK